MIAVAASPSFASAVVGEITSSLSAERPDTAIDHKGQRGVQQTRS